MQNREGGCLCGSVRYVVTGEVHATVVCHCTHCQKASGSAFSVNLLVEQGQYTQDGETSVFIDAGDSGLPSYRHFCAGCGSPVITIATDMPGMLLIKSGTLDQRDGVQPQLEIYTAHAARWRVPVAGATGFAGAPQA